MTQENTIQVDVISDVVCPWCIVGFRQLGLALQQTGLKAALRWHPFELNPQMPPKGQNLREHIAEKYGTTDAQGAQARENLAALGASLGFQFNYTDDMRMVNTFKAHQLLDWAEEHDLQTPLKLALFDAYFTENLDVYQDDILIRTATKVGLPEDGARDLLVAGTRADSVRQKQQFWTSRGISGVPAMVFERKYLVTGAQGQDNYAQILTRCLEEAA